ncbi:FecR family protein [Algoriphagus sp.]|uniref:FecR family protein n=1 Tax=Algoriphagus sp. TaxID=1872435 RepID=UPI003F6F0729
MTFHHPDYQKFSVEDFTFDPFFKEWVLYPTPEHDEFWMRWLESNPEKTPFVDDARELVLSLEYSREELSPSELQDVWSQIQEEVDLPQKPFEIFRTEKRSWKLAAGILAVLFSVATGYWLMLPRQVEFVTDYGETLDITLPDSSTVKLNSNSRLTYSDNWEEQTVREITIEGEAFFSVVHKVDHQPFRVLSSKGVTIEVLGTEFNVYNLQKRLKLYSIPA